MLEQNLKEVAEVIRNAKCNRTVYTTHDLDIMLATKLEILEALKQKWPQEAANIDLSVPSVTRMFWPSKL